MSLVYSHICAATENNIIGLQGDLPWDIPEDLKYFKEKTLGKVLIMGRKTFESLGQALPKRLNIVISRNKNFAVPKNVLLCSSLDSAYQLCEEKNMEIYDPEIFIIGGGEIYRQSLSKVTFIYLTRIHRSYEGDACYPEIPMDQFQEIDRKDRDGNPSYSFLTYKRKNPL